MKIGIDIVEIERLSAAIARTGHAFLHHVYAEEELVAVAEESPRRLEYLAGRWAAKEAIAKALGCGIGSKCSLSDICILNDAAGAPVARLSGAAAETAKALGLGDCQISISHERHYAAAVALFH